MSATAEQEERIEQERIIEERAALLAEIRAYEALIEAKRRQAAALAKQAGLTQKR